jgi:hypothetical protein
LISSELTVVSCAWTVLLLLAYRFECHLAAVLRVDIARREEIIRCVLQVALADHLRVDTLIAPAHIRRRHQPTLNGSGRVAVQCAAELDIRPCRIISAPFFST